LCFITHVECSKEPPPSDLGPSFKPLIDAESFCYLTFNLEGSTLYVHKVFLCLCEYFASMFFKALKESKEASIIIPDIPRNTMLLILEYLYTDTVDIPHPDMALEVPPTLLCSLFLVLVAKRALCSC